MTKSGRIAYSALVLAFIGFAAFSEYQQRALKKSIEAVEWDAALTDHRQTDNFITPTVGTIQFIKHGRYSIEIQDLKYTGNGLELSGLIGNATPLTLSTLTVTFTASRPYYKNRERYLKERSTPWDWYSIGWADDEIGKGQVLLEYLNSGSQVPFTVTIPNAKQTSDETEFSVSFSGERYAYR